MGLTALPLGLFLLAAGLAQAEPCVPRIEEPAAAEKAVVRVSGPDYTVIWLDRARAWVKLPAASISFERKPTPALPACAAPEALPPVDWLGSRIYLTTAPRNDARVITGQSLAGVQVGRRVVFFPSEGDHPRTVSFDVEGGRLEFLLTGLATGTWEIWWNGGLMDPDLPSRPGGTLTFTGPAGNYFLRRR